MSDSPKKLSRQQLDWTAPRVLQLPPAPCGDHSWLCEVVSNWLEFINPFSRTQVWGSYMLLGDRRLSYSGDVVKLVPYSTWWSFWWVFMCFVQILSPPPHTHTQPSPISPDPHIVQQHGGFVYFISDHSCECWCEYVSPMIWIRKAYIVINILHPAALRSSHPWTPSGRKSIAAPSPSHPSFLRALTWAEGHRGHDHAVHLCYCGHE